MADLLWKKSGTTGPDTEVMEFLAGEDVVLDRELLLFDLQASAAHANGLEKIGVLSKDENYWRSRNINAITSWYFQQADSSFRQGQWVVFTIGIRDALQRERVVRDAMQRDPGWVEGPE